MEFECIPISCFSHFTWLCQDGGRPMVCGVLEASVTISVNITSLIFHCQFLDQVIVDPLQLTAGDPRFYSQSLLFRCLSHYKGCKNFMSAAMSLILCLTVLFERKRPHFFSLHLLQKLSAWLLGHMVLLILHRE
ncbi:unnamed protein product [Acanthoscelides obtectus]|nr:unnamed protein product [Acanthoscelides obtectus]CAK1654868.1 hypothetical protein AOBTE_LOCUS18904 [Acanthoscelides obtectus]